MSREIKFRAWDKEKESMLYESTFDQSQGWDGLSSKHLRICMDGFLVSYIDDDGGKSGLWEHETGEPNKRFILEQFTGLRDKNGKEIYEGDIVKDPQGNVGEVFYLRTSWMVRWHRWDGSWDTDSCIEYGEVIGNTHENPELLK